MTTTTDDDLDLLVVGSGVAGLSAAVRAADVHGLRVGVVTKGVLDQATTRWAQGGVAAVLGGMLGGEIRDGDEAWSPTVQPR